jgi:ATP-dependent DNA helicase 2 subunit 2
MGEVYYVWADPGAVQQQIAMSSVVQAMYEKNVMAIARWVNRDDADPKMGVLAPCVFESVDCFLWTQVSEDPKIRDRALMSYRCRLQTMSASTHSHP